MPGQSAGGLAARLHEEAYAIVAQAAVQHESQVEQLQASLREQQSASEQHQQNHQAAANALEAELRQLQQTLSVKQGDITQLNRDNERLATELRDAQRQTHQQERLAAQLELALKTTQTSLAQFEGLMESSRQEMAALRDTEIALRAGLQAAEAEKERLEALLEDTDIAHILQARRDGATVTVSIAVQESH